jgi:hypothetical protein
VAERRHWDVVHHLERMDSRYPLPDEAERAAAAEAIRLLETDGRP